MIGALSQRARVVAVAAVAAVAAATFFVFGGMRGKTSDDPFDAMPRDAFLVATVNLAELRRSPLFEVLLGNGNERSDGSLLDAKVLGMGKLAGACGFDPLGRVETLALGVPEEGDKGEFGVAARVTVTRDELARCSENLAGQRGGKVATSEVNGFVVVEESTSHEAARPRIAYGHGGLLVVGRGAWFDAMLATADRKRPGVREAPGHAAIRSSLTSKEGWKAPTIVVTALLPRSLRERLKREMGAELGAIAPETASDAMGGVLGVSGVGAALRAGASGQSIDGALELTCDAEEACVLVEKLILKKRLEGSKALLLRMVGLGTLLDSIEVTRDRAKIRVTAGAPANALATTLERVLRVSGGTKDSATGVPATAKAADATTRGEPHPARSPTETIPAPRSSR